MQVRVGAPAAGRLPLAPMSESSPKTIASQAAFEQFLNQVRERIDRTGRFGTTIIRDEAGKRLICPAIGAAAPASYRLELDDRGRPWVSLVMADRWLSQSIEQDLVHTGDKLEDLLEEELTDLASSFPAAIHPPPAALSFEHFRSSDLLFTFRSPLPVSPEPGAQSADTAALWLLAYEATFRRLGDMEAGEEE